jgi:hypothetical protein
MLTVAWRQQPLCVQSGMLNLGKIRPLPQELRHQQQIKQMQAEFAAMLKDTLEKLQQRLEERHTGKAVAL